MAETRVKAERQASPDIPLSKAQAVQPNAKKTRAPPRQVVYATTEQLDVLKAALEVTQHPKSAQIEDLASQTGLTATWIKNWFIRQRKKEIMRIKAEEPPDPTLVSQACQSNAETVPRKPLSPGKFRKILPDRNEQTKRRQVEVLDSLPPSSLPPSSPGPMLFSDTTIPDSDPVATSDFASAVTYPPGYAHDPGALECGATLLNFAQAEASSLALELPNFRNYHDNLASSDSAPRNQSNTHAREAHITTYGRNLAVTEAHTSPPGPNISDDPCTSCVPVDWTSSSAEAHTLTHRVTQPSPRTGSSACGTNARGGPSWPGRRAILADENGPSLPSVFSSASTLGGMSQRVMTTSAAATPLGDSRSHNMTAGASAARTAHRLTEVPVSAASESLLSSRRQPRSAGDSLGLPPNFFPPSSRREEEVSSFLPLNPEPKPRNVYDNDPALVAEALELLHPDRWTDDPFVATMVLVDLARRGFRW
ncbi:hypothetical protein GLOTRDRAFT_133385 [Gloeophyllum trabeum ATCC 11539]|uniref:Homeobox domain-containing protein n=1 Tax=Gloeophyllum trabeum (strain ATCC 11539 / FP-39264 / Madison 617) TaxID=670483 RepID=S7PUT9_GLOTA|nr:uncharacterized protein GLOTRDRAFT_133385 [Gloeophyllum trabeum ATCC 11539]EPQ51057.1 hypothetical protein GLOTRDRAFT_133385 [Gloeophyllum trabeum ATCC 11539]